MGTEEELPYWHLEHEVLLTEAKADISDGAMEEAGGSEHQNQVKVPRKGCLETVKEDSSLSIVLLSIAKNVHSCNKREPETAQSPL